MKQILFIDSGIGGLSTLAECMKNLKFNYIYYADNKNCPYGNHSASEILRYLSEIIENFSKTYSLAAVVIACNTATAAAIDQLRKKFNNLLIIGTEPAIALAKKQGFSNVFALTTPLTKQTLRYNLLVKKSKLNVSSLAIKNLVPDIETWVLGPSFSSRCRLLFHAATALNAAKNSDCIVLGCTHYVFFKPFLKQLSTLPLLDGNSGIAHNLTTKINNLNLKTPKKTTVKIVLSKPSRALEKNYKKILSQTLAKTHNL